MIAHGAQTTEGIIDRIARRHKRPVVSGYFGVCRAEMRIYKKGGKIFYIPDREVFDNHMVIVVLKGVIEGVKIYPAPDQKEYR